MENIEKITNKEFEHIGAAIISGSDMSAPIYQGTKYARKAGEKINYFSGTPPNNRYIEIPREANEILMITKHPIFRYGERMPAPEKRRINKKTTLSLGKIYETASSIMAGSSIHVNYE